MKLITCCLCLLSTILSARTWTDRTGRSLEADLIRIDGTTVIVKRGDKEIPIQRATLSDNDGAFLTQWEKDASKELPKTTPSGAIQLDGKPITRGETSQVIEKPYSPESLKEVLKLKGKKGTTGDSSPDSKDENDGTENAFKLAVALPPDFDPLKPTNVFIVITAVNSEAERVKGNVAKFNGYAKTCISNGWVCIAIDSNGGVPQSFIAYQEAFALMAKNWPGFATSRFSAGGFSGGSKGCWGPIAWLVKNKYQTGGVYMGGCNEDWSAKCRETVGAPSSGYRKIRAFVSTGKADQIATPAQSEGVVDSLKSNGVKDVRFELHEGAHSMSTPHLIDALKWFASADP